MKNLLIALLLVISINALAQSFEGTLVWSIKTDITDPAMKAQMEESQKQMQDPARIAEMKKQMDDPQFKAMMEQNPQMKAQMEKMMAMMQSGNLQAMVPTGMTIKIKNQNVLTKMEGGIMTNEFLYLKNSDKSYELDRSNKTYTLRTGATEDTGDTQPEVKVTRTTETGKVLNYSCTKYLVEMTEEGHSIKQYIWATKDIKDLDFSSMAKQRMGGRNKQALYFKEIEGVPMKIEMAMPQGTMIMQVTEVKRGSLPAADFTIPAGYTEIKDTY